MALVRCAGGVEKKLGRHFIVTGERLGGCCIDLDDYDALDGADDVDDDVDDDDYVDYNGDDDNEW